MRRNRNISTQTLQEMAKKLQEEMQKQNIINQEALVLIENIQQKFKKQEERIKALQVEKEHNKSLKTEENDGEEQINDTRKENPFIKFQVWANNITQTSLEEKTQKGSIELSVFSSPHRP